VKPYQVRHGSRVRILAGFGVIYEFGAVF